jgi:hypothetical protein
MACGRERLTCALLGRNFSAAKPTLTTGSLGLEVRICGEPSASSLWSAIMHSYASATP